MILTTHYYPYVFTMGGGQYCRDFHQAADILLQRSYPEVFNNSQTATVFIPETFLPAVPLAVGTRQEMEAAMQRLDLAGRRQLKVDPCLVNQAAGDWLEERVYKVLKSLPGRLGVVIQGACLRTPGGRRGDHGEQDFIVVNDKLMYILVIECKKTLDNKSINDPTKECQAQLERMRERL